MEKALFSISCTTCRARLVVRSKEAIGEILECPKCSSMVLISPPEGWVPGEEPPATPAVQLPSKDSAAKLPRKDSAAHLPSKDTATQPSAKDSAKKPPATPKRGDSDVGPRDVVARQPASEKPAVQPPPVQLPTGVAGASAEVVTSRTTRLPVAASIAVAIANVPLASGKAPLQPAAEIAAAGFTPFQLPEVVAGETFLTSLTRSLWGRVAVMVVSGVVGLACVLVVWALISGRRHATDAKSDDGSADVAAAPSPQADPNVKLSSPIARFNRRWLPEKTLMLVDLRMSQLAKQPPAMSSLALLGNWWQPSSQALLLSLNLGQEQVRRLTWASTDLNDCAASCVVVLELEDGIDASSRLPGRATGIDLGANLVARRPSQGQYMAASTAGGRCPHHRNRQRGRLAGSWSLAAAMSNLPSGPMNLLLKSFLARAATSGRDGSIFFRRRGRRTGRIGPCRPSGWMSGRPASRVGTCSTRHRSALGLSIQSSRPAAMRVGAGL